MIVDSVVDAHQLPQHFHNAFAATLVQMIFQDLGGFVKMIAAVQTFLGLLNQHVGLGQGAAKFLGQQIHYGFHFHGIQPLVRHGQFQQDHGGGEGNIVAINALRRSPKQFL